MYLPIRWLVIRSNPNYKAAQKVTPKYLIMAIVVVVLLFVLLWFVEAGNKLAALVYGVLMAVATVGALFVKRKQVATDESDA